MIIMSRKDDLPVQTIKSFDESVHLNGKYILDYPNCIEIGRELGENNPFNLGALITTIEGKLLEAYPSYDFLIYEPLLDSSSVFDGNELFPKPSGHTPSRFRVGATPNVTCLPKETPAGRSGVGVTPIIDISALTDDGLGRETFLPYWRVVKKVVSHDVTPVSLSSYGQAETNTSPMMRYTEALESEYSVYISENNGNTYEEMTRLTPFSFSQRASEVRLAFLNESGSDLYLLSYALMF
jgi:hypothetical protein